MTRVKTGSAGQVYAENRVLRLAMPMMRRWIWACRRVSGGAGRNRGSRLLAYSQLWLALRGREAWGASAFNAEDDERLLTILGAQVGSVYENGALYREVQEQATQLRIEAEERERAVAQLRASEELFRQLAENIQDVFFVSSPDLAEVFYISPGFERIWGRPAGFVAAERGEQARRR